MHRKRVLTAMVLFVGTACSNSGTRGDDTGSGRGGSGDSGASGSAVGAAGSSGGGGALGGGAAGTAGASGIGAGGAGGTTSTGGQAGGSAGAPVAGGGALAGASGATSDDEALVVPQAVTIMGLPGGHGILEMFALTIRKGPTHTEMYAALKNVGDRPVCDGALTIDLYDKDGMAVVSGTGGLLSDHLYRLTDGSGNRAACVDAGEVTMASMTDLPPDVAIDTLGFAVYRNPYFGIPVERIDGFTLNDVEGMPSGSGMSYAGTLVNGLDIAITNPTVMIFPLNSVGRPLGMAVASAADTVPTVEVTPGGSWPFTTSVEVAGVGYHAYATGKAGTVADGGQAGQAGAGP